jgi:hypothetical protein
MQNWFGWDEGQTQVLETHNSQSYGKDKPAMETEK